MAEELFGGGKLDDVGAIAAQHRHHGAAPDVAGNIVGETVLGVARWSASKHPKR